MRETSSIYPAHFGLEPGAKPVRAWPKRRATAMWDGCFSSSKVQGSSWFEGLLDRDFQTHLAANPAIKAYAVQPHHLIYWAPDDTGEFLKRRYTPDVVALGMAGEILVFEVKAKVFAESDRWRRLEPYIREAYETDHGAHFAVFTEDEIRAQPRLSNCEIMLRHRPPGQDDLGELVVRTLVNDMGPTITVGAITEAAAERAIDDRRSFSALMRMALSGEIQLDLSQPLSASTTIELAA